MQLCKLFVSKNTNCRPFKKMQGVCFWEFKTKNPLNQRVFLFPVVACGSEVNPDCPHFALVNGEESQPLVVGSKHSENGVLVLYLGRNHRRAVASQYRLVNLLVDGLSQTRVVSSLND